MALTDSAVQQAGGSLLQELQSSGCNPNGSVTVGNFQTAFNQAGGTPTLKVDNLYGPKTQAGLQAVLNVGVNQPPQQAPAGCVGSNGSGGGGNTPGPIVPSSSGGMSSGMKIGLVAGAAVLLAGGIWYVKKHKKGRR